MYIFFPEADHTSLHRPGYEEHKALVGVMSSLAGHLVNSGSLNSDCFSGNIGGIPLWMAGLGLKIIENAISFGFHELEKYVYIIHCVIKYMKIYK